MEKKQYHITTVISEKAKKNINDFQKKFNEKNKGKITKMIALNLILENYQ